MRIAALARRHGALLAGLTAQALQYGSALVMLPILVSRLTTAEVGLWYLFVAIQGLTLIADFGFQPTFARNFALAHSGVAEIRAHGIVKATGDAPNWPLFAAVMRVARRFYLALALILFALLATAGLWYVGGVATASGLDPAYARRSWLIFSAGVCLGVYFLWVSPVLIGLDRVRTNYRYLIVSRGSFALVGVVVLLAGGRLTALAVTLLVTDLVGRLSVLPSLAPVFAQVRAVVVDRARTRAVFLTLLPNAGRTGIVGIAAFLILKANAFVVTPFLGIAAMASFGVTAQLVGGIHQVGLLPMQVGLPRMIAAHVRCDRGHLRRLWLQVTGGYVALFVTGTAVLAGLGGTLLATVGSRVSLIPLVPLLLLCLVTLLEGIHTIAASLIQASNRVPFVPSAIVSGVAVVTLSVAAAAWGWGLTGIILAQGIVQACYNNWRWPTLVMKELRE